MTTTFDVAVVGAGPAGLNAALVLGRMRRRVVVLDTAAPANAVSRAMHGFLSRDGTPPADVRRVGREQLQQYESVDFRQTEARSAIRLPDGRFRLETGDGGEITARRLLIAHGMRYGLPDLDGVAELWGERVFHCPYCHGWEVRDRPLAVFRSGERALHQALLLTSLSKDVAVVCDGDAEFPTEERERLGVAGIDLYEAAVERVERDGDGLRVVFTGRPALGRHALFIQPKLSLPTDLSVALGAELAESGSVETDQTGGTSVPGLYAAGDAGATVQSVAVATGGGARAAYAINSDLAMEDTAQPRRGQDDVG